MTLYTLLLEVSSIALWHGPAPRHGTGRVRRHPSGNRRQRLTSVHPCASQAAGPVWNVYDFISNSKQPRVREVPIQLIPARWSNVTDGTRS